ncbi:MAG: class I SAM-dependent methyltransferase [Candidatus Thermoplasmatota archaeon]|nr:class I SAM-dependent methyltransferase [Candidatus Thermoplasmatota archaeon]
MVLDVNSDKPVKNTLYLDGEEKFGYFSSRMYGITKASKTIRNFYKFVVADLSKHSFQTILDVGSGRGYILSNIVKALPEVNATGIDPSPFMVKLANKHASREGLGRRMKFMLGSSRDIPGNEKFDVIITTLSFHHWKNRNESVSFLMKRLNAGGVLLIYEISDDGSINRKFVSSHLLGRSDFESISKETGVPVTIAEDHGYIRAEFSLK